MNFMNFIIHKIIMEVKCINWDIDCWPHLIESAVNYFKNNNGKKWHVLWAGMGCNLFIRHNGEDTQIESFFMHSDNWGQYDPDGKGDIPKLLEFTDEYEASSHEANELVDFLNSKRNKKITCPSCRTVSNWNHNSKKVTFQLSEGDTAPMCVVCNDNTVEVYLENCGHTALCRACAIIMAK